MSESENALTIYRNLYFSFDESKPSDVHERVAKAISNDSKEEREFLDVLDNDIFRPNSPCLINAGISGNLCACFVLGLDDTMESIINMWDTCAKIYAGGGGSGIPIGNLREKGSPISGGGSASGPLNYLNVIESISNTVKSGGRARRAANLATFPYNHPDILKFIKSKTPGSNHTYNSINISVLLDDKFMELISNGDMTKEIDLISPNKNAITGTITIGEIWNAILECAYYTGDPGILYYDTINKANPLPTYGMIQCANPCSEVPLPDWSECVLGSINLNKVLNEDNNIDLRLLKKYTSIALQFLDNIIDKTTHPHPNFKINMEMMRPVGIGIIGFADILYKKRIRYGSSKSLDLMEFICKHITKYAFERSIELVVEGISPIPLNNIDKPIFRELLLGYGVDIEHIELFDEYGIRNSQVTSLAPTGSIALTMDASYAFEPHMALAWEKQLVDDRGKLTFINEELFSALEEKQISFQKDKLVEDIIKHHGSIQNIKYIPKEIREIFVTAHDINSMDKLKMQSKAQKYISLGISSTCNLPQSATYEDIEKIYIEAWKLGLKGITIYRDNCKENQPVSFGSTDNYKSSETISTKQMMDRPSVRTGKTIEIKTPYKNLYITGNITKDGKLLEVFFNMGELGRIDNLLLGTLARLISKALQNYLPLETVIDTMLGMKNESFWFKIDVDNERSVQADSIIDAIAKVLDYHFNNGEITNLLSNGEVSESQNNRLEKCPNCGRYALTHSLGCRGGMCTNCNYSNCS